MRHSYFGKKLSRTTDQRKQLIRNLLCDLIIHGSIKTTKAKAVAIRPTIEKLITRAKKDTQVSYRLLLSTLGNAKATKLLVDDAKTRFAGRTSGYVRILHYGLSGSDAKDLVQISFVDPKIVAEVIKPEVKPEEKKERTTGSKAVRGRAVKKTVNK